MAVELEEGGGFYQSCYFDAGVTLTAEGHVATVVEVGKSARDKIEFGMEVIGASAAFPSGSSEAVPVHVDAGGNLLGGYASCEKFAD